MKYLIIKIAIFCVIIAISGCGTLKQKKADRKLDWLKRNGFLAVDSFVVHDTVRGFRIDTIVRFDALSHTDTLTLEKEGVKSTTIIKWKERIVSQEITKLDTIYKFKFKILKEIKTVEKRPFIDWIIFWCMLAAILGLIFKKWGG